MSMNEERLLSELPEPRASSLKVALGVAAAATGLAVLLCGGVAGYVALTTTDRGASEVSPVPPSLDAGNIRERARTIVAIDIPAGFEPIESMPNSMLSSVTFGRKSGPGALLKLGRTELQAIPPEVEASEVSSMMLQMLEMGDESSSTLIQRDPGSTETTGEFTVLGQPTAFTIVTGTRSQKHIPVTKISGVFRTRKAYVALIYLIPTAEHDEGAFQKLLDSIRPAGGDGVPEESLSDGAEDGAGSPPAGDGPAKNDSEADTPVENKATPRSGDAVPDSP